MVLNRRDILEQARQLPPEERELLAREIWQTMDVDPDDLPLSPEWEAEIRRRIDDLESGRTKALSYEEAMARARSIYEARRKPA